MKTLVIHPSDETTDFLKRIYADKDWTVVNDNIGKRLLRNLIRTHDRIVMMGHGCDKGLFDGEFNVVVDANLVQFLREKECVGIWCHAQDFFVKYNLTGFCTGMFVSDYMEANLYCVNSRSSEIDASNNRFADVVSDYLFKDNYYDLIKENYAVVDAVTEFNNNSLYKF